MLAHDPNSSVLGLEADLEAFLNHPHSHDCENTEEDVPRPDLESTLIDFLNHPHSRNPTETDGKDNATIFEGEYSPIEAVREPPSNREDELLKPRSGHLTKQVDILGGHSEPLIQLGKSLSAQSNEQEPHSAVELLRSLNSYYQPWSPNDSPAFSREEDERPVGLCQSLRRSSLPDYERVIILVGPSGSGKTSFMDYTIGENSNPCMHSLLQGKSFSGPIKNPKAGSQKLITLVGTTTIKDRGVTLANMRYRLIDTPGFGNAYEAEKVMRDLSNWLDSFFSNINRTLVAILYFHRITDPRVSGDAMRGLKKFKEILNPALFCRTFLAMTGWEAMRGNSDGIEYRRQEEFNRREELWGSMITGGSAESLFIPSTREGVRRILDTVAKHFEESLVMSWENMPLVLPRGVGASSQSRQARRHSRGDGEIRRLSLDLQTCEQVENENKREKFARKKCAIEFQEKLRPIYLDAFNKKAGVTTREPYNLVCNNCMQNVSSLHYFGEFLSLFQTRYPTANSFRVSVMLWRHLFRQVHSLRMVQI